MPATAPATAQVFAGRVDVAQVTALGPKTAHVTVPVGVPADPDTVTVKEKDPPVTTPDALSATVITGATARPPRALRTARATPRSPCWRPPRWRHLRSAISSSSCVLTHRRTRTPNPDQAREGSGRPSQLCRCPRGITGRQYPDATPRRRRRKVVRWSARTRSRSGGVPGWLGERQESSRRSINLNLEVEVLGREHTENPRRRWSDSASRGTDDERRNRPAERQQGHSRPTGSGVMMGAYGGKEAAQADRRRGRSSGAGGPRRHPRAVHLHPLH